MGLLYDEAGIGVRADLDLAHQQTVESWASPGDWWSASERLAIVDEVRRARAADELPPWVQPSTVDGLVDADHALPMAAVDAVWRLTNHSGTLTEEWYRQVVAEGLSPEQYVELVGVVATANCLEVFATALGIDPIPLPVPAEGEPARKSVAGAAVRSHWVPTADVRGPNVGKALTASPVSVDDWNRLSETQYVPMDALLSDLTWSRGTLDRMQIELLAARTSLLNECFY